MEKQILNILHGYDIGNIHSINILENNSPGLTFS